MINEQIPDSAQQSLINLKNDQGYNPLMTAIEKGNKEVIYRLRQSGAKFIDGNYDKDIVTAKLLNFGQIGNLLGVQMYYYAGLQNLEDYVNVDGRNIAHICASYGGIDIIKFLKDEVAFDFSVMDLEGRTAYDDAKYFGFGDIMELVKPVSR